jgi:hypothetical protein
MSGSFLPLDALVGDRLLPTVSISLFGMICQRTVFYTTDSN